MGSVGSLEAAREEFFDGIETPEGTYCPCCDRYGKLYKRKLNHGMARCLIWLYRCSERTNDWNDRDSAPRYVLESGEIGKLAHWGLAVQKPNIDDPKKKESGMWKITHRGRVFIQGRLRVPSHAYLYDNICRGFTESRVDISGALGEPFNYRELMRESPP